MRRAMRWREAAALAFALLVACVTYSAFQGERRTERIVVAASPVAAHSLVESGDVRYAEWPAAALSAGMLRDRGRAVGRYALRAIAPGEPVLAGLLSADPEDGGIRAAVPPGETAVAIPIEDEAALPPVAVGDLVDLIVTTSGGFQGAMARALVRGAEVIGLRDEPRSLVASSGGVRSLVVAATPEEAERIAFALANGRITVVLEGYRPSGLPTTGVDAATLFGRGVARDGE